MARRMESSSSIRTIQCFDLHCDMSLLHEEDDGDGRGVMASSSWY